MGWAASVGTIIYFFFFRTRDMGDEYHILLACDKFKDKRKAYEDPHYCIRPNVLKYNNLMNTKHAIKLKRLGQFLDLLLKMPNKIAKYSMSEYIHCLCHQQSMIHKFFKLYNYKKNEKKVN